MCKLALLFFVFVAVARGNPARSLDERLSEESESERAKMKELLKGLPKKYNPFANDLTPEAMYQLQQNDGRWLEIMLKDPKANYHYQMVLWMGTFMGFLPALWHLTGDCNPLPYLDEKDDDRLTFEVTFQVKEYCYGKYSDKYVPIKRVVDDQFKQVNEYVANAMKGAEMLKKFCSELINNGPSIEKSWENSEAKKWMKECKEKEQKERPRPRGH